MTERSLGILAHSMHSEGLQLALFRQNLPEPVPVEPLNFTRLGLDAERSVGYSEDFTGVFHNQGV